MEMCTEMDGTLVIKEYNTSILLELLNLRGTDMTSQNPRLGQLLYITLQQKWYNYSLLPSIGVSIITGSC
jgi:hypothetical protein